MVRIHAEPVGPDKTLVSREELGKLIEAARKVEEVELIESVDDLPVEGLARIATEGGSFQFLEDPREDLYTVKDLKVRRRHSYRPIS